MTDRASSKSTKKIQAPIERPVEELVPLESVLCTDELEARPSRPPDYETENRTLVTLAQALADSPRSILQVLAETILVDFDCDSAGVSLLTKDEKRFYWPAIAGQWKPHIGGGTPRDFGPCGDVLDRNAPLLFRHFERRYTYFLPVTPPAQECLLVPLYIKGKAVGTVWAITHNKGRKFDSEDLRRLVSVGRFASLGCESIAVSHSANDSRRAALNVMEDALQARHAAENLILELRASEDRYRTLFESIDEGFGILEKVEGEAGWQPDFRYVEVNPAFSEQSGLTGVVGKTIREVIPGESESWVHTYDTVLRTGTPVRFERALVCKQRMLELYAFRIEAETQRRVAVIFKDITERKQVENLNSRLAAIVESSEDAIIGQDFKGFITTWNAGAERLFGYTAQEAVGQPKSILIPPERVARENAVLEQVRRGETVDQYETVRLHKDGTPIDVSLAVSPIRDYRGRIVGASKILRDISATMKAAESLREADRQKDDFLAILAHELRNPLAPIRYALEIIRHNSGVQTVSNQDPQTAGADVLSRPFESAVNMLDRQVGQLVRLIDDLLDVSRISRGKIELRLERLELSSVIRDAVESIQPSCDGQGHQLTVKLPPDPVYVNADPTRLAQMVGNLLNNACKFTQPGGHIWLSAETSPDSIVTIRVRDTGIGIDPGELPRVFEMFAQADHSLERALGGLGIGLSLVKTLTQMHGGTVEASSPGLGQGAEFVVRLPTVEEPSARATQRARQAPSATPAFRILIVDDSRDAANSLAVLLHLTGHETHVAHDGWAAVEAAARLQPDVILLDIGLPKLNGYEAATRIREQQTEKRPVIVAVTGWGKEDDRRRSKDAGFDAHLVKPMDFADLNKLLSEISAGRPDLA